MTLLICVFAGIIIVTFTIAELFMDWTWQCKKCGKQYGPQAFHDFIFTLCKH